MTGIRKRNGDRRGIGQSEVVGLIAIFGVTFVGISIVLATGLPVVSDATENAQVERTQSDFAVLDEQVRKSVYTPGQSGATIDLGDEGFHVDNGTESVTMEVEYDNGTDSLSTEMELGTLEYNTGDSTVSYEAGGVWTTYFDDGFSMRTPPDITYTGSSVTMNLVNFTSNVDVGGDQRRFIFASEGAHKSNELESIPGGSLEDGTLTITVSDTNQADAWEEYLRRSFPESSVSSLPDGAEVELGTGPPIFGVEHLGERYTEPGLPAAACPPLPSPFCENDIINITDSRLGGDGQYVSTVDSEDIVDNQLDFPADDNDLEACVPNISDTPGNNLPTDTVTAGDYRDGGAISANTVFDTSMGDIRYYYDNGGQLNVNNDVEFDTSGGTIEIYLPQHSSNDRVQFNPNNVEINGDNPVRIFTGGQTEDVEDVGGDLDDSPRLLQVYSWGSSSVDLEGKINASYYAPEWDVTVGNGDEVRGAAVAEGVEVRPNGKYYHDTALRSAQIPDCLRYHEPVKSLNVVERLVSVR